MELLRGTPAVISFAVEFGEFDEFDESPAPTVTIVRDSTGETVVTDGALDVDDAGTYSYALTAAQAAEVDLLHVTASGKVDGGDGEYTFDAEIVGGYLVTAAVIERKFSSDITPPARAEVIAAREIATRSIEDVCGVAFRPRYGRERVSGSGLSSLLLARPQVRSLLSVSVAGTDQDLDGLKIDAAAGLVYKTGTWTEGDLNTDVAYIHGYENFPPAGLPVLELTRHLLLEDPSVYDQRATSVTTEDGTYSLVTAGLRGNLFPLPSVNAFVQTYGMVSVG